MLWESAGRSPFSSFTKTKKKCGYTLMSMAGIEAATSVFRFSKIALKCNHNSSKLLMNEKKTA
jgi:hypothetical protein